MKERGILFSAPMVRALLAGTKTQTRRVATPKRSIEPMTDECPYGPGDLLWVREAWRVAAVHDHVPGSELGFGSLPQVQYVAIGDGRDETRVQWGRYRHARFMPRWASRITLEITEVRVERLQAISQEDARAEGFELGPPPCIDDPGGWYRRLWEQINGPSSWEANPWVWCVSFRRLP